MRHRRYTRYTEDAQEREEMERADAEQRMDDEALAAQERAEGTAAMEPWASPALVEPAQTGVEIVVKGKISTVRWLEDAPYSAKKVRAEKGYWNYALTMQDVAAADQLMLKLEGSELAATFRDDSLQEQTGVWTESWPLFAPVPVHPAFAALADFLFTNPRHRIDGGVVTRGTPVDGNEVLQFALEQIRKVQQQCRRDGQLAAEVAAIYADVWTHGGDAYGQHKPRLQQLAAKK